MQHNLRESFAVVETSVQCKVHRIPLYHFSGGKNCVVQANPLCRVNQALLSCNEGSVCGQSPGTPRVVTTRACLAAAAAAAAAAAQCVKEEARLRREGLDLVARAEAYRAWLDCSLSVV